jgi:peptidyl-prolyl cis-trans isomerase A (cyclophilin A)
MKQLMIRELTAVAKRYIAPLLLALSIGVATSAAQANTLVRVSTTYGDFTLELFDDVAPVTVQNFLNYVNRGDYNGTFFNRVVPGFVVQGGSYYFEPFLGPVAIPTDPPIGSETNLSNTRGTIAMARLLGQPSSATSAFYINVVDNNDDTGTNLDTYDGGYTVFGEVMGDGMSVIDAINAVPVATPAPGTAFQELPLRNYTYPEVITANKFITLNAEVVQRHSAAISLFEYSSGLLMTSINGGDSIGLLSLNFSLLTDRDDIVFKLNMDSLVALQAIPDGAASFSLEDNRLRIPTIELNNNGNIVDATDAVLLLTDAENFEFTLESIQF